MKVTMKNIASRAGVSVNTVSLALRNMPSVKTETRELIFKIAEEMGYFEQKKRTETKNICLISTGDCLQDSYFYMDFYQKILNKAMEYHYNVMIYKIANCDIETADLKRNFERNYISGAIILGDSDERIVSNIAKCGIPVIGLSTRYYDVPVTTFVEDNLMAMYQAVRYLRQRGFTEIGFVGNPNYSTSFMDRYAGFVAAMQRMHLPVNREYMLLDMAVRDDEMYIHTHMERRLRDMPKLPQAFVCSNDNIAILMSRALQTIGLSVPQDMSLIGVDNSAMGKLVSPPITSVDVQSDAQTAACMKKLIEFMRTETYSVECHQMPVKLVEGGSVRPRTTE